MQQRQALGKAITSSRREYTKLKTELAPQTTPHDAAEIMRTLQNVWNWRDAARQGNTHCTYYLGETLIYAAAALGDVCDRGPAPERVKALRAMLRGARALVNSLDKQRLDGSTDLQEIAASKIFWPVLTRRGGGLDSRLTRWLSKHVGRKLPKIVRDGKSPLAALLVELMDPSAVWKMPIPPPIHRPQSIDPFSLWYGLKAMGFPQSPQEAAEIKTKLIKRLNSRKGNNLLREILKDKRGYWRKNKAPTPPTLRLDKVTTEIERIFSAWPFPSLGKPTA